MTNMPIGKADFISLITKARDETFKKTTIKAAWKHAGIELFRPINILKRLPN